MQKVKISIAPAYNERTLNGLNLLVQWSILPKKEGLKLLTLIGYNLDEFIEELKKDPTMINPTLPEWDSECSDIAGELFEILDTNDDNVLNQKDSNPLLTKRNSKLIANKVKDLGGFQ